MSGSATCSPSPTRIVDVGSLTLRTLPLPEETRPSQIFSVTIAGLLSATHTEASVGSTVVSTGVYDEPWDIFTGNITAIYYL